MILRGARVALGPEESAPLDIQIRDGRLHSLHQPSKPPKGESALDLGGYLILPGLINAHDHLEFNLYPRLGRGPYPNAGAWARDVYRPEESPVREQLSIPKNARLRWGGLKNLLSGVTTVCHHNPWEQAVFERTFPVRVLKQFGWAHSLEFSADVAERFGSTPPEWPFILHLGEGTDREAKLEVFRLDALGAMDGRTVLIHAVALGGRGLRLAKQKGAALIWCPSSNLFMLGATLDGALTSGVAIALGSDSAVTAKGDLLDEIRIAKAHVSPAEIYSMVTDKAARILRLPDGFGKIIPGGPADLIAIDDQGRSPCAALVRMKAPALVLVGGKVKLIAPGLASPTPRLQQLHVEGRGNVLVDANASALRGRVAKILGENFHLAHRRVLG